MADDVRFDTSQLRDLATRLDRASGEVGREVVKVIKRGALNLRRDMRDEASGSEYFSGVPASITYETFFDRDSFEAEIGPEIGKGQGSLAFLAYEGTHTGGPVFPDPALALAREVPKVMDFMARAAQGPL